MEHLLEHLHPLFSLFCLSCFVTLGCFVNSLPAVGYALVSWVLGSLAVLLSSRPFGACFIQPNPMISMPTSPSESLLLFTPWNQLSFDVTGFKNTQASRDNRSCHFHAQLCRCTESAAPALSRASLRLMSSRDPPSRASSHRLNDAFNVMSFLRALVSSCTRQSSVFNAKTRSSVPSAPLNRHYQCTHEFSRVSSHFTHCWAYRPVYREMNSLVVKVSKLVHFQPDFWTFARAVLNSSRAVCFQ